MTNIVPIAGIGAGWTSWELEALAGMQRALEARGLPTEFAHGVADDGAPWITFFDERDGSFVAHVARDPATYLLICSDQTVERSPALPRLLQVVQHRCKHDPHAAHWLASR